MLDSISQIDLLFFLIFDINTAFPNLEMLGYSDKRVTSL